MNSGRKKGNEEKGEFFNNKNPEQKVDIPIVPFSLPNSWTSRDSPSGTIDKPASEI